MLAHACLQAHAINTPCYVIHHLNIFNRSAAYDQQEYGVSLVLLPTLKNNNVQVKKKVSFVESCLTLYKIHHTVVSFNETQIPAGFFCLKCSFAPPWVCSQFREQNTLQTMNSVNSCA